MKQFRKKNYFMFLFLLGLLCSSALEAAFWRGLRNLATEVKREVDQRRAASQREAALKQKEADDLLKRIQRAKEVVQSSKEEDIHYSDWVVHKYLNESGEDDFVYIPPSKFDRWNHENRPTPDYSGDIFGLSDAAKELIKIEKYLERIKTSKEQLNAVKRDIRDKVVKSVNNSNMSAEEIEEELSNDGQYMDVNMALNDLNHIEVELINHQNTIKNAKFFQMPSLHNDILELSSFLKGENIYLRNKDYLRSKDYYDDNNYVWIHSSIPKSYSTSKKNELLPKLEQAEKAFILKQQKEENKPSQAKEALKKATELGTHLLEEQMKAKMTADAEQKKIKQIFEFLQDPKKIAPVMAGFAAVAIAGASSFQFCGVFAQMLLKHYQTPQLIEWTTKLTPLQQLENRLYLLLGSRLASRFKLTFHQAPIRPFSDFKGTKAQMEFMNRYLASLKKMLVENAAGKAPLRLQSLGLFGQPGTGKTLLAQCLAHELGQYGFECYAIDGSSLQKFSETEALVQLDALFKYLEEQQNPSILFVDEAHSLLKDRRAAMGAATNVAAKAELIVNKWLAHIPEGLHHKILIIYSANYKEYLDPAILNRLTPVYFGAPDFEQRDKILALYEAKDIGAWGISFSDDYTSRRAEIIQKLEGLTGRQIRVCVKNMVDRALVKEELMLNFEDAIFAINDMLGGVGDESSAVVKMSSVFAQKN